MQIQKIVFLLIAAATLFACSEHENPAERTSTLKLVYAVQKLDQKSAQGSDTTAPQSTPKQMVVTIHNESGNPVLNGERFDLVKIGEEYYSKSILLPTGHYTLEEFMVIDSADRAVYIAPRSGSDMAPFVNHPLPYEFVVNKDVTTDLLIDVVPAGQGSAEDFGYAAFSFHVVRTDILGYWMNLSQPRDTLLIKESQIFRPIIVDSSLAPSYYYYEYKIKRDSIVLDYIGPYKIAFAEEPWVLKYKLLNGQQLLIIENLESSVYPFYDGNQFKYLKSVDDEN